MNNHAGEAQCVVLGSGWPQYERKSLLITSNLTFSDWGQVFQGERMTAGLLDRLTHRCHIFEMNGESFRFRESMKNKKSRKCEPDKS
jgi:hypothetical protein